MSALPDTLNSYWFYKEVYKKLGISTLLTNIGKILPTLNSTTSIFLFKKIDSPISISTSRRYLRTFPVFYLLNMLPINSMLMNIYS